MSVAKKLCQAVGLVAVLGVTTTAYGLAFPGAVGFGKNAIGGRSTTTQILFVDTLADAYPGTAPVGSLRAALNTSGPRIIIFRVGGVINLAHDISPASGNITIAGQTAPGQGIVIRGHTLRFRRNEIICRGVRFRPGDKAPNLPVPDQTDGLKIGDSDKLVQPTNVVVDHCSVSWSKDEMIELAFGSKNVTISNNVFGEPLWHTDNLDSDDPLFHGYGSLIESPTFRHEGLTFYRNLFATSMRRNPWIKTNASVEYVNNVIYNWYNEGLGIWGGTVAKDVNVIGNYFKAGFDTQSNSRAVGIDTSGPSASGTKIYMHDNIGPNRTADTQDDWLVATVGSTGAAWRQSVPVTAASSSIAGIQIPIAAWTSTMQNAGAQPRDGTDARLVSNALRNPAVSQFVDSVDDTPGPKSTVDGYPIYYGAPSVTDNDNDGMADTWELANGLNPASAADAKVLNNGYLNIEHYINSLIGTNVANTYQAEAALPTAGSYTLIEDAQAGYTGLGYVNFPLNNGTLTFNNVDGRGGGTKVLTLRYAFSGPSNRVGTISVNGGTPQTITMAPTGSFTTWGTITVNVTLNNNSTNSIVIKSTGTDLGNLDWIAVQ